MSTHAKERKTSEGGDRAAFEREVAAALPVVRATVRRMVGHPEDSEDIVQEALGKAWASYASFRRESAFATWLTTIATRLAVDHLRKAKRWRPEAQIAYANLAAADESYQQEVLSVFAAPDFSFEVREHVAYCFACVGRSLPADEQAALVLADVMDMSAREAAKVLGVSESVFRHRLAAARQTMRDRYENLCALVSKTGMCHQCKGLRQIAAEDRRGGAIPDITDYADRLAAVRSADFARGPNAALHDLFWRRTNEIEEAGSGSTKPENTCGSE
ncbi:RNA polymerase sigma factor [Bauldia sp.]|uniref:RNA polymerase sigma factor n=1 Tax=Bauldia sp. TaxID=2575872 RepID=UPI003BACE142